MACAKAREAVVDGALLAGVPPADLLTLVLAVGACSVVALSGSVFSALRAMRVDPARVLRSD